MPGTSSPMLILQYEKVILFKLMSFLKSKDDISEYIFMMYHAD